MLYTLTQDNTQFPIYTAVEAFLLFH